MKYVKEDKAMKELSIEEKAEAYDEAIKRAKVFKEHLLEINDKGYVDEMDYIFPELKESENEKMIQYFKDLAPFDKAEELYEKYGFSHKDAIAWLEKQGGQKPNPCDGCINRKDCINCENGELRETEQNPAWSEEDERKSLEIKCLIGNYRTGNDEYELCSWIDKLKNRVQPKQEWSDEDNEHIKSIISTIECSKAQFPNAQAVLEAYNSDLIWLKSIKERCNWKPSDEQMNALNYVVNLMASSERPTENDLYYNILKSLRQQLKKLMEDKLKDK